MDVIRFAAASACLALALATPATAAAQDWDYHGPQHGPVDTFAVSRGTAPPRMLAKLDAGSASGHAVWLRESNTGDQWWPVAEVDGVELGGVVIDRLGAALIGLRGGVLRRNVGEHHWEFTDIAAVDGLIGRMAPTWFGVLAEVGADGGSGLPMRLLLIHSTTGTSVDVTPVSLPVEHSTVTLLQTSRFDDRVVLATDVHESETAIDPRAWLSQDDGATWSELDASAFPARRLAAATFDSQGVVAVFERGWDDAWGHTGVYRSDDGGQNWVLLDGPYSGPQHLDIETFSGRLWLGAESGLYRSDDAGTSWQLAHDLDEPWAVTALAADPGSGVVMVSTLRTGTHRYFMGVPELVYPGDAFAAVDVQSLSIRPTWPMDYEVLSRGWPLVFRGSDLSLDWSIDEAFHALNAGQLRHAANGQLYAAAVRSGSGVLRRLDNGTWATMLDLPPEVSFPESDALSVSPTGQTLFVALRDTHQGARRGRLLVSHDHGNVWNVATQFQGPISRMELHPARDGGGYPTLLVGHRGYNEPSSLLVRQPTAWGWTPGGHNLPFDLRHLQACATDGTHAPRVTWLAGFRLGRTHLFRSRDGGLNFELMHALPFPTGYPSTLWCDPRHPDVAVVGHESGLVVHVGGSTPVVLGQRLTDRNASVADLTVDWGRLIAATRQGVWSIPMPTVPSFRPQGLTVSTDGMRLRPTLTVAWSGGHHDVVIRRDGVQVYSGPNTGQFSERLSGPQNANPTYRVCNRDWPTVCAVATL